MNTRALVLSLLLLIPADAALAQRRRGGFMMGDPNEYYQPPEWRGNKKYDGRFTFARIKYRGYAHWSGREGPGWSHDFPRAEEHLTRIMNEITSLHPFIESDEAIGGNILALDDPELFKYPVAYLSEPGGWYPTDSEVLGMRKYLQKGGFVIVDDFDGSSMGDDLLNFTAQMQRVMPNAKMLKLADTHPIFDSFFKIDLHKLETGYRGIPEYYAFFQDNDPKKRIMMIVNLNNDIGEYWQWSNSGFAVVPSNEAYKLGVNYIIYAMTH